MLQLISATGQQTVDALAFLLAFALTALMDSVFHDKLPHDHGRAFAVNGELSKGKARGSGLIFVLCIALVTLAVVPFKVEYLIYTVLLIASMLSGYFDDASETAWNEYKKGLIDFVIAVVAGVTYLNFNGTSVNFLSTTFTIAYPLYLLLIVILIWASINVVNCTDGVDGLSASLAVVSIGTFLLAYGEELGDYSTAAIVFKTISDQYGKYSMVKVLRGRITSDMALYNPATGNTEKLGRLYIMKGKKGEEVKEICCGDIGAIGKMDKVKTGNTLCDPKRIVRLHGMDYAQPCYSRAISPKTKQEVEKLGTGLNKLNEEDPTFHVVNNAETHQTVISGAGDIQIDVLCSKLKTRFGVDAELSAPRVAYREKIRSTVRKQGRYKKQTGGSGQFGDVWIRFEPNFDQEEMVFAEDVFGGSVPKNYFPAVEKGLRESCLHGVLAGYPVVYLKATLVDGSYHPVDSSEIAFKLAANLAFKAALPEAKPVLMEPIGELKVTVPDNYVGDVMGDLNKRRGRVMGMNPTGDGETVLEAEVPMAEMMSYAIDLRSMTQSRGTFTFNFVRYEDCPAAAQEKAIAEAKALADAE